MGKSFMDIMNTPLNCANSTEIKIQSIVTLLGMGIFGLLFASVCTYLFNDSFISENPNTFFAIFLFIFSIEISLFLFSWFWKFWEKHLDMYASDESVTDIPDKLSDAYIKIGRLRISYLDKKLDEYMDNQYEKAKILDSKPLSLTGKFLPIIFLCLGISVGFLISGFLMNKLILGIGLVIAFSYPICFFFYRKNKDENKLEKIFGYYLVYYLMISIAYGIVFFGLGFYLLYLYFYNNIPSLISGIGVIICGFIIVPLVLSPDIINKFIPFKTSLKSHVESFWDVSLIVLIVIMIVLIITFSKYLG